MGGAGGQREAPWLQPALGLAGSGGVVCADFVVARQEMIHYEKCDPRGWDVGSGPMESMCGATTDRIKGRGRRWGLDSGAERMSRNIFLHKCGAMMRRAAAPRMERCGEEKGEEGSVWSGE